MKTKILPALLLFIFSPVGQALACAFCYGAKDGKSTEHMAVAIWFLFGAVMFVLSGIGAFSFHLWRHGRMPAEPHQEITEEDLSKYE
jgi:putative Mn2+ efflux pump MntP